MLENPDIVSRDSESSVTSATEDFPSLPSQNSVEQETLSTISSTDDSIVNEEAKTAPTTESKGVVVNDSEGQDQTHLPDQIKETDGSDNVLEDKAEDHEPMENKEDSKSHLNGDVEQSESHNVEEFDNGVPVQHTAEINNIHNAENESLQENHVNNDENLINESNTTKLKKNFEVNINDANNADYISNEIRNCGSQDDNPKLCSKQVLPQQIKEQEERAIDCPS